MVAGELSRDNKDNHDLTTKDRMALAAVAPVKNTCI